MKTYQEITYQFLYDEYILKNKSIRTIAKETSLTKKQIQRLIYKFDIPTRKTRPSKNSKYQHILTQDFLYNEYINKNKSIREISQNTGIDSKQISKFLDTYKIAKRTCGTRKGKKNKNKFIYKSDIKIGTNYEYLTVIDIKDNQLICKCKCGNIKQLHSSRIRLKQVKSCGCLSKRRGVDNPLCKGFGNIPKSVLTKCIINARDRNIDFHLTIEDLDSQYKKQNGKCSISGVHIGFKDDKKNSNTILCTSSLDRIDSSKGYTKDNIQWVHKKVQQMKWNIAQKEFIEWCKIIASNN